MMSRKNFSILAATASAIAVIGGLWAMSAIQSGKQHSSAVNVPAGAALYAENCAACHGNQLEGKPDWQIPLADGIYPAPPHNASGHTWHHDDALLFNYTKDGGAAALQAQGVTEFKSGMPGFGQTLSDQEIRDILGFIESTWPERIRKARQDRLTRN